jgi:RND family efflux transporter MFP subunit
MKTRINWMGLTIGGVCLALVLAANPAAAQAQEAASPAASYTGFTRPSDERQLNFQFAGVVQKVNVKKGQTVKAGTVLMELDSRMDRSAFKAAEVEAKSTLKDEYAKSDAALKKVVLARFEKMFKDGVASVTELEEKQLDSELAGKRVELGAEETLTKRYEAERLKGKLDLAQLPSPIDGVVQRIDVKEGEIADPNQSNRPACVVVTNDPLKVEVFLPTGVSETLKIGQELEVQYPKSTEWQKAKITFFDPVADAASQMRKLDLELPNPSQRVAGWEVQVRVPPKAR